MLLVAGAETRDRRIEIFYSAGVVTHDQVKKRSC
jgi:hypothetical protein